MLNHGVDSVLSTQVSVTASELLWVGLFRVLME